MIIVNRFFDHPCESFWLRPENVLGNASVTSKRRVQMFFREAWRILSQETTVLPTLRVARHSSANLAWTSQSS